MSSRYKYYYPDLPLYKRIAYALLGEVHIPGKIRHMHVLSRISRIITQGKEVSNVLDAGCGRGELVFSLARKYPGWKILGTDLDEERIRLNNIVRDRIGTGNVSFRNADIFGNGFEPGFFDLILCCDVLEHIPNDQDVVDIFYRLLAPGGFLIMTFPSVPQLPHLSGVARREKRLNIRIEDIGHVRGGYSLKDVARLTAGAGFPSYDYRWTYGKYGTLAFDLFFIIGDSKPNPLVFLPMFPLLASLAYLDLWDRPDSGSALLVVARK